MGYLLEVGDTINGFCGRLKKMKDFKIDKVSHVFAFSGDDKFRRHLNSDDIVTKPNSDCTYEVVRIRGYYDRIICKQQALRILSKYREISFIGKLIVIKDFYHEPRRVSNAIDYLCMKHGYKVKEL